MEVNLTRIPNLILNSTRNSTEGNPETIPLFNVMICVFNIPLSLVSVVGNVMILAAIWKTTSLHSPAIMLLSNLAVTDLSVGLLAQPLYVFNTLVKWQDSFANLYRISGEIYNLMAYCLCGASFLTVTAISVDRLLALEYHLRYNTLVTPKTTSCMAAAIWLISGFISSMRIWNSRIFYPGIAVIIGICLFSSFFVYFKVHLIVRRHQAQIHCQIRHLSDGNNHRRLARLTRSAVNTFYVYCLFLFCYLPYLSILMVGILKPQYHGLSKGYAVTATVVSLNSALNPVLYCWRLSEVRRAVKQIFRIGNLSAEPARLSVVKKLNMQEGEI